MEPESGWLPRRTNTRTFDEGLPLIFIASRIGRDELEHCCHRNDVALRAAKVGAAQRR